MSRSVKRASSRVFDAAASPLRIQMLRLLNTQGPLAYSEIMESLNLDPGRDAGKFAYHLRSVLQAGLIDVDKETKKYMLTDLGRLVVDFSQNLEEYAMKKSRKLLVRTSRLAIEDFDRNKIVQALVREAGVPTELAEKVAEEAEERLLRLQTKYLTAPLIREFVNSILIEKGLEEYRHKLTRLGLPVYDVTQRIREAKEALLNVEAVHKMAGNRVMEEYMLLNILPRDIADAHLSGVLHICNTGCWIIKPNEIEHDLRVFFHEGFRAERLGLLSVTSNPPESFEDALSLSLNVLKASSIEAAGEQALDYFNVFIAPFVKGIPPERIKGLLRLFIFSLSQSSSNGRLVEATLGLELSIPDHLKKVEAIGPGGRTAGYYGDYEDEARKIFEAAIDIMFEDSAHKPIFNPHIVVKIRPDILKNKDPLLLKAHKLAANGGIPYFANLHQLWQSHANYTATGTRLASEWVQDWELDTIRTGNLDYVLINLPRIAYEARGNDEKFFETLENYINMASLALEIKHQTIEERMQHGLLPFLTQLTAGEPYFRLENSTHLISCIGLNEATKMHTGHQIFESKDSLTFAIKLVEDIAARVKQRSRKPKFRLSLSQTSDDQAAQRLAELDIEKYGWANVSVQGTKDAPYYTDLTSLPLEADLPLNDRLQIEGKFHVLTSGGHLAAVVLKEPEQKPDDLLANTERLCQSSEVGFFTYTRDLTYCVHCQRSFGGILQKCPRCKSSNTLTHYSRSLAKYLPLRWWAPAKQANIARRVSYSL